MGRGDGASVRRTHPIYVDGPLEGQDFPVAPGTLHVQAIDYGPARDLPPYDVALTGDYVTYELHQFAFHSGGRAVSLWLGSCAPGKPDAITILRAICKPELLDRAEVLNMPPGT